MRNAFQVDQPSDHRWDLAIQLLSSGEGAVAIGMLNLLRDTSGLIADGRLKIEIRAAAAPAALTIAGVDADVAAGLAQLDTLLSDGRLAALASEHGMVVEYVNDYDTGRVGLATISEDRSVAWHRGFEPNA